MSEAKITLDSLSETQQLQLILDEVEKRESAYLSKIQSLKHELERVKNYHEGFRDCLLNAIASFKITL